MRDGERMVNSNVWRNDGDAVKELLAGSLKNSKKAFIKTLNLNYECAV
jgi:hypothetical protein